MRNKTFISVVVTMIVAIIIKWSKGVHPIAYDGYTSPANGVYDFIVTLLGSAIGYSIDVLIIPLVVTVITMIAKRDKKWSHDTFSTLTYICLALFIFIFLF